jgi:hypothetical protein
VPSGNKGKVGHRERGPVRPALGRPLIPQDEESVRAAPGELEVQKLDVRALIAAVTKTRAFLAPR